MKISNQASQISMPSEIVLQVKIYLSNKLILGLMLAHKAEEEGIAAVEYIKSGGGHVNQ